MEQKKEVIICPQCRGTGQTYRLNRDNTPYMSHGRPVFDFCSLCDGNGRLLRLTTVEYMRVPSNIIDAGEYHRKQSIFDKIKSMKGKNQQ